MLAAERHLCQHIMESANKYESCCSKSSIHVIGSRYCCAGGPECTRYPICEHLTHCFLGVLAIQTLCYCVRLCCAPVIQSMWCSSLRVYLQVEKQISLTDEKFKDLYTYMDIMHMCPDELDGRY